jgi:acetolactate synthase I/II/III large subunit
MQNLNLESTVLISCAGQDTGGGLFAYNGRALHELDRISSCGITHAGQRTLRLIRVNPDTPHGEILVYDKKGIEKYYRIDSMQDAHEILWDGKNYLITSTSTNSVLWVSPDGKIVKRWKAPGNNDAWHLNSLFTWNGFLLVSAFGKFEQHREWHSHLHDGSGIVYNITTGENVITGLNAPHNPIILDMQWVICNSATAELLVLSLNTKEIRYRVQLNNWTRGIATTENYIFVGESANRKGLGENQTASIAILDRKSFKVIGRIHLPCREISSLTTIPHNAVQGLKTGFRTNSDRVAEQDQFSLFSKVGVKPKRLWGTGEALPPEECAVNIWANPIDAVSPQEEFSVSCQIENMGFIPLSTSPPYPIYVSYKWIDKATGLTSNIEGIRNGIFPALMPNERREFKVKISAPREIGNFILRLTLVQEMVCWFDEISLSNKFDLEVQVKEDNLVSPILINTHTQQIQGLPISNLAKESIDLRIHN